MCGIVRLSLYLEFVVMWFGFRALALIWFSRIMGLIYLRFFWVTLTLSCLASWLIGCDLEREG